MKSVRLIRRGWPATKVVSKRKLKVTEMVRNAFFAMCHTNVIKSMENVTGFLNIANYPSPTNALRKLCAQLKFSLIDLETL